MQDLTGHVRILPTQGQQIPVPIGKGSFTDVFEGQYRKVTAVGMVGYLQTSKLRCNLCRIPLQSKYFVRQRMTTLRRGQPLIGWELIFHILRDSELPCTPQRLIRESNVWLRLKHPNIQPYIGHCSDLGLTVALISPLCPSGNIKRYITINPSANKLQLVSMAVHIFRVMHILPLRTDQRSRSRTEVSPLRECHPWWHTMRTFS
jgi:serine/threonine protein kinase